MEADGRDAGAERIDRPLVRDVLKLYPRVPLELAKRYGTAEGAAFVNGLLERAVTEGVRAKP